MTSRAAVLGLCLMQVPIAGALALVAWRVERVHVIGTVGLAVALAAVTLLLGVQVGGVLRANRRALTVGYPPEDRYPFASVLVLALAYGVTFGTELAVISLLPTFFASTFALKVTAAGAAGSAFAFTNLVTRPGGGIASDISRSRRRVLISLMLGVTVSFVVLSTISHRWPVAAGIAVLALASVFVQAGNGAVFAMVPLVKRRVGGQIAGLAGAYGNIGGILLSSLLFFTATAHRDRRSGQMVAGTGDVRLMFLVIAGAALVVALVCRWLPEPAAHPATAADTAPGAAAPVGRETSAVATAP